MNKNILIRCSDDTYKLVNIISKKESRSMNAQLIYMIHKYAEIQYSQLQSQKEFNNLSLIIQKGVPLPKLRGKKRKYDLPLEDLDIDDSVIVPIPKTKITQEQKIIRNFVLRFSRMNPNKKFTVRQLDDGIGIWRIK